MKLQLKWFKIVSKPQWTSCMKGLEQMNIYTYYVPKYHEKAKIKRNLTFTNSKYSTYRSSCDLKPVDASRPALKNCSMIFEREKTVSLRSSAPTKHYNICTGRTNNTTFAAIAYCIVMVLMSSKSSILLFSQLKSSHNVSINLSCKPGNQSLITSFMPACHSEYKE